MRICGFPFTPSKNALPKSNTLRWPRIVDVELMKSVFSVAALSAVSLGEN
jgi:hypothetical protein